MADFFSAAEAEQISQFALSETPLRRVSRDGLKRP